MSAHRVCRSERGRLRRRAVSAAAAVIALVALVAAGPLSPAHAADPGRLDQISGFGNTDSAVTVNWADGVTGTDNKSVVAQRTPDGTNPFVDDLWDSYKNLKVTVNQTTNLTHQDVQVSWSGGTGTPGNLNGDYLQLMQCYGDAKTGPDPENCQWGAYGVNSLPSSHGFVQEDRRYGSTCDGGDHWCDPAEPTLAAHRDPNDQHSYNVPFVPVGTTEKDYYRAGIEAPKGTTATFDKYYTQFTTNEVPLGFTSDDGTGQTTFEAETGREASGLGCGDADVGGKPRACWLVIVPRGLRSPNGSDQSAEGVVDSALSASNWAQRLQVRLTFQPTSVVCPRGADERPVVGSELVASAITSWQPALCTAPGGAVYGYSATSDAATAAQLDTSLTGAAGLGFTTTPIARADGPPLLYAPVAITGMTLGFRIDSESFDADSAHTTQVRQLKLTPELLAKSLTQSYKPDLPGEQTPPWMKTQYDSMSDDPQWQSANPGVQALSGGSEVPRTTEDQSAVNQQFWSWVQTDPSARAFLRGAPDPYGMVVNPSYQKLNLGDAPASTSFPRADPLCYRPPPGSVNSSSPPKGACITSIDFIPYVNNLEDAAVHVQRGDTGGRSTTWDPQAVAPDGSSSYWDQSSPSPVGRRFSIAFTSTADSARYGLNDADLCNADDSGCVAPSTASLTTAVGAARPDSSGLLHVNPAEAGAGGYPLTDVVYAAVRTDQSPDALRDYAALLDYAAGPGQVPGTNAGQLPPGYLPLPAALRAQAAAAATTLRADAAARGVGSSAAAPSSGAAGPGAAGGAGPGGAGPAGAGGPGGGAATTGGGPGGGSTASTPPAGGPSIAGSQLAPAAKSTPREPVGAIRWLLLVVVVVGAAGAVGGPMLRRPPAFLTGMLRRGK